MVLSLTQSLLCVCVEGGGGRGGNVFVPCMEEVGEGSGCFVQNTL